MDIDLLKITENDILENSFTQTSLGLSITSIDGVTIGCVDLLLVRDNSGLHQNLVGYIDQSDAWSVCPRLLHIVDIGYGDNIEQCNFIYIESIFIEEEFRGKGVGTKVLNQIIQYAQKNGFKQILLTPQPIDLVQKGIKGDLFSLESERLSRWYSKFGFKTFKNEINDDYSYMQLPICSNINWNII